MTLGVDTPALTFIVPVRHQDNASDWPKLKSNLEQTLASLSAQLSSNWHGVVVANHGADLPPMPEGFSVERVDFPANKLHDMGSASRDEVLDAFRLDKGRRVLAGMLAGRDTDYFMIVDDDDCVSNRLAGWVRENSGPVGWKIGRGYVWNDGSRLLYEHDDFNHVCGSSLIIQRGVYELPDTFDEADMEFVKAMMGSHHGVDRRMEAEGTPLQQVPFRAAVYRVGHAGSHSQTAGIFRKYVLAGRWKRHLLGTLRRLARLRRVTAPIRREFFGGR